MLLGIIVLGALNWQVALNSGGLTITDSGPGVIRIHQNKVQLGEPTMVLYGRFQPAATPDQLQ